MKKVKIQKRKMDITEMRKIETLMDKGFPAKQIGEIIGRSESGVQNYMNIIENVRNGKPFKIHPHAVNYDLVCEYCELNGFGKPVNAHPLCNNADITETNKPIINEPETDSYMEKLVIDLYKELSNLHLVADTINNFAYVSRDILLQTKYRKAIKTFYGEEE